MQLAIDGLAQPNAGLAVVPSAFMAIHRDLIITLAARKRLPAIYGWNYFATSGGLVSYGSIRPVCFDAPPPTSTKS